MSAATRSLALLHGERAFGARFVRAGYCFAAEDDLAFALGFPYLRVLDPDHLDDLDCVASAELVALERGAELRTTFGPRTAGLAARLWLLPELSTDYPAELDLTEEARAALRRSPHVDATEARSLILDALTPGVIGASASEALLLLEALVGPSVVVTSVAEGARAWDRSAAIVADPAHARVLATAAIMTLRLPEAERNAAVRELEGVASSLSEDERSRAGLLWEGEAASVEPGVPCVLPPAARVVSRRAAHPGAFGAVPDPRLAFLGGDVVLDLEARSWRSYTELPAVVAHELVLERFAPIRSPAVVPLMVDLWRRSTRGDDALAWLEAHADLAAPAARVLAESGGALAPDAALLVARWQDAG